MKFRRLPVKLVALHATALVAFTFACGSVAAGPPDAGPQPDAAPASDSGADVVTPLDAGVVPAPPMNTARSLFGAVSGSDGRVRVFGGLTTVGLTSSVEAYDAKANAWTDGANGKVGRYAHTVAQSSNGDVYVIGGTSNGKTPIGTVEIYSEAQDSWTSAPDLPTPRLGLAAATAKDGRIFAIGGGVPGAASNVVEVYTPGTKTWAAGPSMPTARLSLQAVTGADGLIYAIGGRDDDATPLAVVEVLDPVKGEWTSAPPLKEARYWFAATRMNDGRIAVLGGIGENGFLDGVEALDAKGWSPLSPLPEKRAWLAAAVASDGRLLAVGGSIATIAGQPPPVASVLAYDAKANAWSK